MGSKAQTRRGEVGGRQRNVSGVTAHLFSSYVDNVVFASEAKQSHSTSFIDEIASAEPRNDRFYSKKPEQLRSNRTAIAGKFC
jgi:hypothetical protein